MTSVNMIFFIGGPQLGEVEAGFVASLLCDRRHRRHGFDRDRRPGHRSRGGRGRSRHARGPALRAAPGLTNALHCTAGWSSRR